MGRELERVKPRTSSCWEKQNTPQRVLRSRTELTNLRTMEWGGTSRDTNHHHTFLQTWRRRRRLDHPLPPSLLSFAHGMVVVDAGCPASVVVIVDDPSRSTGHRPGVWRRRSTRTRGWAGIWALAGSRAWQNRNGLVPSSLTRGGRRRGRCFQYQKQVICP